MKKGHVESVLPLLLFMGVTGSGKTLFKRLLLGQSVPEFSPSTPLAEPTVRTMSICQVAVGSAVGAGDKKWEVVGPNKMIKMVANTIKGLVSLVDSAGEDSSNRDQTPKPTPQSKQVRQMSEKISQPQKNETRDSTQHSVKNVKSQASVPERSPTHTSYVAIDDALKEIQIDSDLLERMKNPPEDIIGKLMDVNMLYLLDSGGQPPFREMLPHFVQKAAAIVLMMKLNERLDFKPTIRYREKEGKVDEGYESQLTNEEIMHQYIQAVQTYASKVFLVGTHMDRVSECQSETREMKNEKLLKAFSKPILQNLELYKVGNPDQLIFPVDCTSRGAESERVAQEFRNRVIEKCMGEKKEIPLPWFIFDQLLILLSEKMKAKILSTEECYKAAKEKLHMSQDMCKSALKHLGELNIIFYLPNILPKVVFSTAQILLNKITELVRCSHALRTSNEDTDSTVPSCMQSGEGLQFKNFGQVSAKLLEKAFPSHYREGLFNAANFLELLEGLLIAAKLKNGNHFIPSLLPDMPYQEVKKCRVTSSDNPAPLVIHYPKMWLPVGVMPSLVVYLRNEGKWDISEKDGGPACLYHNCIKFRLPGGRPGSVFLLDSTMFLEIHVKLTTVKVDSKLCHTIKEAIMTGLKEAHTSLHYDPPEAEIGFLCSGVCGNTDEPHLATLDDKKKTWRCSEDDCTGSHLTQREQVWIDNREGQSLRQFC